jgi:exosome complex RNA-binding protein Rrp4
LLTFWSMELNVPSFQALPISETSVFVKNLICSDKIRMKMFMNTGDVIIAG